MLADRTVITLPGHEAVDRPNFRPSLLTGLRYISAWITAEMAWALLQDDALLSALEDGVTPEQLIERVGGGDIFCAEGLLKALWHEGVLTRPSGDGVYQLAPEWSELRAVRGWYELFLAGYRPLFQGIGQLVREGRGTVQRNALHVALGSAGIGTFDAVPMILRLIDRLDTDVRMILDYGCGNAFYLMLLCQQREDLRAIGVEVAPETVASARRHIAEAGLDDRVTIVQSTAQDYFPAAQPDVIVIAFVMHEIRETAGRDGTVKFLRTLAERYPQARLVVVEVCDPYGEGRETEVMEDAQGRGYYNYYLWLHAVTHQRLQTRAEWLSIFEEAGYRLIAEDGVDEVVDPTGFEIGFALERADVTAVR